MSRLIFHLLIVIAAVTGFHASLDQARGQGRYTDVMVTVVNEKVVALPGGGRGIEESLDMGETVVSSDARGQTGFAQTSSRLLGFSSELRRWTEVRLSGEERVELHQVLPRLIVAQTDRQLYGFLEVRGHWTSEALGTRETVKKLHGRGHVVVAISSDRALAFSSFTGGFFSIPWSTDERVISIDETNDAVMVRTSSRTLVFQSQTTEWREMK